MDAKLGKLTWKRFATGLYQPLGLKVVDGKVTYQPVAEATGEPYAELFDALGAAV